MCCVLHVINLLLITPFTNAKVERMFSRMKRVKTDWRNKLRRDSLESLLRISEEGVSVDDYNPDRAIEQWYQEKKFDKFQEVQDRAFKIAYGNKIQNTWTRLKNMRNRLCVIDVFKCLNSLAPQCYDGYLNSGFINMRERASAACRHFLAFCRHISVTILTKRQKL